MPQIGYLNGNIYHMVHFNNLNSIFRQGAILSKETLVQKNIKPYSIAYEDVQDLRHRISLWDACEQKYRGLHGYVPFYFAERPPMMHVPHIKNILNEIVIVEVSRSILREPGVVFTNGNAAKQQLSHDMQRVRIIPASNGDVTCKRIYYPEDNPHGMNTNCSDIYHDITFLDQISWDVLSGARFVDNKDGEYARLRSAEVLIPDKLLIENLRLFLLEQVTYKW